jgi:hypothetical protein
MKFVKSALLILMLIIPVGADGAGDWFVVGKESECLPLSILEKKGPEFRGAESPYQLAEKMRAAGHKAEIKEHNAGSRPAVELRVTDLQFYVMFMKADICRKSGALKP